MTDVGNTGKRPPPPVHACHHDADDSQGYDLAGCVYSDCAKDLPQVAPNDKTIPSEEQYRTQSSVSTLETSEAGIHLDPSQKVLGSAVSKTERDLDVSKKGPDELKVLLPDQTCHCATCLDNYSRDLSDVIRDGEPGWTAWTLSCRVTGCQWTTKDEPPYWEPTKYEKLRYHETWRGRAEHYGKPGEWRCREMDCKFVTKRWNDLLRHSTAKHCIKRDLKCPFLECKYHHVDFSRKDKLKSHVEKVHKGIPHPAKPFQAIKPKVKDHA